MRYLAGLIGDTFDCDVLDELFPGRPGEAHVTVDENDEWWLAADELDEAARTEPDRLPQAVLEAAAEVVRRVNGAATLTIHNYRNVRVAGRVRDSATGERYAVVYAGVAEARARALPMTVVKDGVAQPPPRPLAARALDEARRNQHVDAVLTELATGLPDWTVIGRVLDHISGGLGGDRWEKLVATGLLTNDEKKRISATANNAASSEEARHGLRSPSPKQTPPSMLIGVGEAMAVVRRCSEAWLESVCPQ
jgi:hypothetical protein